MNDADEAAGKAAQTDAVGGEWVIWKENLRGFGLLLAER